MAYEERNGGAPRQMFKGNWNCSKCGAAITELPFEPDPARSDRLQCRDCHMANRDARGGAGPRRERRMFQGNWSCSACGAGISELPFEPRETGNLMCRDCFKKN
ncbi:MAG TPA: hypothetical protein VJB70_05150 [Candidatus Paceibacterota bacterium]